MTWGGGALGLFGVAFLWVEKEKILVSRSVWAGGQGPPGRSSGKNIRRRDEKRERARIRGRGGKGGRWDVFFLFPLGRPARAMLVFFCERRAEALARPFFLEWNDAARARNNKWMIKREKKAPRARAPQPSSAFCAAAAAKSPPRPDTALPRRTSYWHPTFSWATPAPSAGGDVGGISEQ